MMSYKVGIVTITYGSSSVLPGFMTSLLAQSYQNWVLLAVDNTSKDNSIAMLQSYTDPRIKVFANTSNVGVAAGNNQGILEAFREKCNLVLLLNNDVEFPTDMLEKLVAALDQHTCDMVAPKMYFYEPSNMLWYAGGGFDKYRFWKNWHYGEGTLDNGQYNQIVQADYAPTCCLLVRKSVFDHIGLMDERYFAYVDDADFCYRVKQSGHKLMYLPTTILYHKVSSLTNSVSDFGNRLVARNMVYFVRKFARGGVLVWALLIQQLTLCLQFVTGRSSWHVFKVRQRAFWEGLHMDLSPS
jgi:GT2 family glycosyltransferase